MSVAAIPSPASRFKRTYEGEAGPLGAENQHHHLAGPHYEAEAHRHKRTRVVHFPHHQHRASSPSLAAGGRTQALESAIASLLAHFPGMDEKVVQDVLLECGSIDAAIKRLTDLKLSSEDATVAAAVAAASVSAATPEARQQQQQQQQQQQLPTTPGARASPLGSASLQQPSTPDATAAAAAVLEDAQQQAQSQAQPQAAGGGGVEGAVAPEQLGPQTAEQWVEVVVTEMLASKDMVDARGRAAQVLQHFERFVKQRQKAELDARLPELAKENQILKRAVQIQAQRAQHKALQEEQQLSELRTMVAHYQEQCRRLELNNYSLAMHLQQATHGGGGGGGGMGPHNPRNPDVY